MSDAGLTKEDLDVLIEAVESWESSEALGELVGVVLTSMVGPKDPQEREEWLRKRDAAAAEKARAQEGSKRARKERSILLRAKLIALRDRLEVEAFSRASL